MTIRAIVTTPPYASFLDEVAGHRLTSGFRLNTVMPIKDGPHEALERLTKFGQPLWVDLKGRQLRVVGAAMPPFTEIHLSHRIRVHTPADAFFSDGNERARVVAVDGDRLILEDGPRRRIWQGGRAGCRRCWSVRSGHREGNSISIPRCIMWRT